MPPRIPNNTPTCPKEQPPVIIPSSSYSNSNSLYNDESGRREQKPGLCMHTLLISINMSGAQGAQPKGSLTPTTYESVGGENKTRTDLHSKEDQGNIQIDKIQDKVEDAAGKGGPVFGAGKDENKQDLGVTGTG